MQALRVQSVVGELRSNMPHGPKPKHNKKKPSGNIVTNSIKTFKMVHIKDLYKREVMVTFNPAWKSQLGHPTQGACFLFSPLLQESVAKHSASA